jgi:hypothetical protein
MTKDEEDKTTQTTIRSDNEKRCCFDCASCPFRPLVWALYGLGCFQDY